MEREPQVHYFESTGDAYDASQCCDEIRHGDVLVVPHDESTRASEDETYAVVGVLVDAWPVAVSASSGKFHAPAPLWDWAAVTTTAGRPGDPTRDMTASLELARAEFERLQRGELPAEGSYFWDRKFAAERGTR